MLHVVSARCVAHGAVRRLWKSHIALFSAIIIIIIFCFTTLYRDLPVSTVLPLCCITDAGWALERHHRRARETMLAHMDKPVDVQVHVVWEREGERERTVTYGHAYAHAILPFYTTFTDLDLGSGSQGQCKAKPVGFIFSHIFQLIRMKYDMVLKQFHLILLLIHIHPDTHTWVVPIETQIRVHE